MITFTKNHIITTEEGNRVVVFSPNMRCASFILFFLLSPEIQPVVILTALLCGVVICLFHWGYRFELSVLERLEIWTQSMRAQAAKGTIEFEPAVINEDQQREHFQSA